MNPNIWINIRKLTPITPPKPAIKAVNQFMGILINGNRFTKNKNINPIIIFKIILKLSLPTFKRSLTTTPQKATKNNAITIKDNTSIKVLTP